MIGLFLNLKDVPIIGLTSEVYQWLCVDCGWVVNGVKIDE